MKHKIFSVYDSKAMAYIQPFLFPEQGQALRAFTDAANDPNHMFCKNAGDYTLFNIGAFDDASAQIISNDPPINLGNALEFKRNEETE